MKKNLWNQAAMLFLLVMCVTVTGCGNKAGSYYKTGMKEYQQGNYEEAAANLEKAIQLKSDNAQYYIDYGYCLIGLSSYEDAETAFNQAILDKNNSIVKKNNVLAYRGLGILYYVQADYTTAEEYFQTALDGTSDDEIKEDLYAYLAQCSLNLGEEEQALEYYNNVIEADAKKVTALEGRAQVYVSMGSYDEAIADYKTALKYDSDNYDLYIGEYQAYLAAGNDTDADSALDTASQLGGDSAQDQYNQARIQYYLGNESTTEFETAIENGITAAYLYLGDLSYTAGDYETAITDYEAYQSAGNAVDGAFYNKLGMSYLSTEAYEQALETFQSGIEVATTAQKQGLMKNEVISYERLGEYEKAYEQITNYLESYSDDEEAQKELEFIETRLDEDTTSEEDSTK